MRTIRKALLTTAVAGAIVGFASAPAHAAESDDLFACNGVIDAACYYKDSSGYRHFCTLWINGCVIG